MPEQLRSSAAFCLQLPSRFAFRPRERYRYPWSVSPRGMLVSIAEPIGEPIGTTPTTGGPAVSVAVTIQRTSGSATTDSGGITDSLTHRIGGVHRPQRPGTSHRVGTRASSTTPPSSDRDRWQNESATFVLEGVFSVHTEF